MTPRGRTGRRSSGDPSYESFLLTSKVSRDPSWDDECDEDINPDSDAAFLRRHRSIDREDYDPGGQINKPGLLQRVFEFMSQSRLLRDSSSTKDVASYGALPNQDSRSRLKDGDLADDDDVRRRDRRKGKSSALKSAASWASFGSRQRGDESGSHSRGRARKASSRESSPMLITDPGQPTGQGGLLGGGLPLAATSEDAGEGDDVISIDDDEDILDPPDNSPYLQVRASVAATDDISASINTPRMWILSLLCALVGSATSLFFSLRYPSVSITPVIALVVVHPLGRAWDHLFKRADDPTETFEYGSREIKIQDALLSRSRTSRLRLWLAQGRWNGKEHACVYISSNVSFGFAFATDVCAV